MNKISDNPSSHSFTAQAMNTEFSLRIRHPDKSLAGDAAGACFAQLETIENLLSRYRPDSDISRINHLTEGESLYIDEQTHACLLQAMEACAATGGLFDISLGAHTRGGASSEKIETAGQLEILPDRPLVNCHRAGRQLDLGGIGKGYALDQLALILDSYQIDSALIGAGASTLLAIGQHTWPVNLIGDKESIKIKLKGQALSASGIGIQGAHVIHPATLRPPDYRYQRVWITTPTAAQADAFSTACLLMDDESLTIFVNDLRKEVDIHVELSHSLNIVHRIPE